MQNKIVIKPYGGLYILVFTLDIYNWVIDKYFIKYKNKVVVTVVGKYNVL